jgi:hypothetical protein
MKSAGGGHSIAYERSTELSDAVIEALKIPQMSLKVNLFLQLSHSELDLAWIPRQYNQFKCLLMSAKKKDDL